MHKCVCISGSLCGLLLAVGHTARGAHAIRVAVAFLAPTLILARLLGICGLRKEVYGARWVLVSLELDR